MDINFPQTTSTTTKQPTKQALREFTGTPLQT
jgi:hypothetical protein